MCPRDRLTRKIGCMSLGDFSFLLDRIGPFNGTFHLHGYGEPLLDRQLVQKIKLLKKILPFSKSLIISTLGVILREGFFQDLIEAGLDSLIISLYGFTRDDYKKIHGYDGFDVVKHNLQLLSLSRQVIPNSFQAYIKIPGREISSISLPVAHSLEKIEFCHWAQALGFEIREWDYLHNYGDGRRFNAPNSERVCPIVSGIRKKILKVTWDFNVIPCSYDFNATICFGNLRKNTLEEIFSSREYFDFIIAHQTNNLSGYPICQQCEKFDYS
jgi:radical SAM protein with 4Fe4S-binding SPASM domain